MSNAIQTVFQIAIFSAIGLSAVCVLFGFFLWPASKRERTTGPDGRPSSGADVGAGTIEDKVKTALKEWYRRQAVMWWSRSSRNDAICDDCNGNMAKGEGFLRPGNNLACESCTDRLLERTEWTRALGDLDGYFGPGVPDQVRKLGR
jgi:hypothetical protein